MTISEFECRENACVTGNVKTLSCVAVCHLYDPLAPFALACHYTAGEVCDARND